MQGLMFSHNYNKVNVTQRSVGQDKSNNVLLTAELLSFDDLNFLGFKYRSIRMPTPILLLLI